MKLPIAEFFVSILCMLAPYGLKAQRDYNMHSHNDYLQEYPFWNAYVNGATSIEVDVFLRDGNLYVAHEMHEIVERNTLGTLYLKKLKTLLQSDNLRELQLLIDIKSEAYATLDTLMTILEKHPQLPKSDKVRFIISGNRPKSKDYKNYPDYIFFDHQNLKDLDASFLEKVALISLDFKGFSVWNGYGRIVEPELKSVENAIKVAHDFKKPFRFWGTPDTKTAWAAFSQMGVDYINTDAPDKAGPYLKKLEEHTYKNPKSMDTYVPEYSYNNDSRPKNIILMIGDGNGLAQISSAMTANKGKLTVSGIKDIGLVKTSSKDDLITDSAAGGTAMATGIKTNNRAIGVGPDGERLKNILEHAASIGFNTAIITTDEIHGATPASFYAHRSERNDTKGILEDLTKSSLDFFMTSGTVDDAMVKKRFRIEQLKDFNNFDTPRAVRLTKNIETVPINTNRATLSEGVKKALQVLSKEEAPFFLVVEGAQIDSGGHANSMTTIVEEMLGFDLAIAEALRVADVERHTLVVVTADHETAGLGIVGGVEAEGTVRGDFLSADHTGILVPLFAYGPMADEFRGTFENTQIYRKILYAIGWKAK